MRKIKAALFLALFFFCCINYSIGKSSPLSSCSVTIAQSGSVKCAGDTTIQLKAIVSGGIGPYAYFWSDGEFTATTNKLLAGNYTVTISDNAGCTSTSKVTIAEPKPVLTGFTSTPADCSTLNNGQAVAKTSGGTGQYTYSWNTGSIGTTASNLSAGIYTLTVVDGNGCKEVAKVPVSNKSNLNISLFVSTPIPCNDGQGAITVTVSSSTTISSYSFSWSTGVNGVTNQSTESLSALSAGNYEIAIRDGNGCLILAETELKEPPPIKLITNSVSASCGKKNGSAFVTPANSSGSYSYSWDSGSTNSSITGLGAGSYGVVVTDGNGCSTSRTITVNASNTLASQLFITDATCFQHNNGRITAVCFNNSSPFIFNWSNSINTTTSKQYDTLLTLLAGPYSVTITDKFGCSNVLTAVVSEPTKLVTATSSVASVSSINCDGSFDVSALGSVPSYNYSWSSGSTVASNANACPGKYLVTVTDANGCTALDSATVLLDATKGNCELHIYTMISPNNDGSNDSWQIDCILNYPGNHVAIFNRWGDRVWQGDDYNNTDRAWRGTNQSGTPLPPGTYFYVLNIITKELNGKIELVK